MTIDLYYSPASAPCRSVLLTAKALKLDLNLKLVNLQKGEHLTPEYLKLNPEHTIPTLARFGDYFYPQIKEQKPADPEKLAKFHEALKLLNTFLEGQKYSAGPNLTLADLCLVATISTLEVPGIDFKKYDNIKKWYETVKATAPGYEEANQKGIERARLMITEMMKKQ